MVVEEQFHIRQAEKLWRRTINSHTKSRLLIMILVSVLNINLILIYRQYEIT